MLHEPITSIYGVDVNVIIPIVKKTFSPITHSILFYREESPEIPAWQLFVLLFLLKKEKAFISQLDILKILSIATKTVIASFQVKQLIYKHLELIPLEILRCWRRELKQLPTSMKSYCQ